MPDAKTLVRLGQAVGPEAIGELHNRLVAIAQERKVIRGRKMRVDKGVIAIALALRHKGPEEEEKTKTRVSRTPPRDAADSRGHAKGSKGSHWLAAAASRSGERSV
jgi:hypothetical protein